MPTVRIDTLEAKHLHRLRWCRQCCVLRNRLEVVISVGTKDLCVVVAALTVENDGIERIDVSFVVVADEAAVNVEHVARVI